MLSITHPSSTAVSWTADAELRLVGLGLLSDSASLTVSGSSTTPVTQTILDELYVSIIMGAGQQKAPIFGYNFTILKDSVLYVSVSASVYPAYSQLFFEEVVEQQEP